MFATQQLRSIHVQVYLCNNALYLIRLTTPSCYPENCTSRCNFGCVLPGTIHCVSQTLLSDQHMLYLATPLTCTCSCQQTIILQWHFQHTYRQAVGWPGHSAGAPQSLGDYSLMPSPLQFVVSIIDNTGLHQMKFY